MKEHFNLIDLLRETQNDNIKNSELLSPKEFELSSKLISFLKKIASKFSLTAFDMLEMPFVDKMLVLSTEDFYFKIKSLPKEYGENVIKKIYSENNGIFSYDDIYDAVYNCLDFKRLESLKQTLTSVCKKEFDESICKSRLYIELCFLLFSDISYETEKTLINKLSTLYQIITHISNYYNQDFSREEVDLYNLLSRLFLMLFEVVDNEYETDELFDLMYQEYIPLIESIDSKVIETSLINSTSKIDRLPMPEGFDFEKMILLGQTLKKSGYLDESVKEENFANLFDNNRYGDIEQMYWLRDAGEFTILVNLLYGSIFGLNEKLISECFYRKKSTGNHLKKVMKLSKNDYTVKKDKLLPLKSIVEKVKFNSSQKIEE